MKSKQQHAQAMMTGLRQRPGKTGWQFSMRYRVRLRVRGLGTDDLTEAVKQASLVRANPARYFDADRPATADWDELTPAYVAARVAAGELRGGKSAENVAREIGSFRVFTRRASPVHVNNADLQRWYDWLIDQRPQGGQVKNYTAHTYVARVRPYLRWLAERGRTAYDPLMPPNSSPSSSTRSPAWSSPRSSR